MSADPPPGQPVGSAAGTKPPGDPSIDIDASNASGASRGASSHSHEGMTAATLLGRNTSDVLASLVDHLAVSARLAFRFDDVRGLRTSEDRDGWKHDLIWACGLLSTRVLESGAADVEIVAAPIFTGQRGARYHSVIVARPGTGVDSDAQVARCRVAINEFASWSGCHALLAHLDERGHSARFAAIIRSGSHLASVEAVARREADAAAIDHTVWDHLCRTAPDLTGALRAVGRTRDHPAPPFLISRRLSRDLRERLTRALVTTRAGDVDGLDGIERVGIEAYRPLLVDADSRAGIVDDLRRRAG